jgi:hypothetical protein
MDPGNARPISLRKYNTATATAISGRYRLKVAMFGTQREAGAEREDVAFLSPSESKLQAVAAELKTDRRSDPRDSRDGE